MAAGMCDGLQDRDDHGARPGEIVDLPALGNQSRGLVFNC